MTPVGRTAGNQTAVEAINGFTDRPTVTLVMANGLTTVASQPGVGAKVIADRSDITGFRIELTDPRFMSMPSSSNAVAGLAELADGAEQVILLDGMAGSAMQRSRGTKRN